MMIALFDSHDAAAAYCNERSKAHGCPVYGKHPRTGNPIVVMASWDIPRLHPSGDGRAWCAVDPEGDVPANAEIVKELPEDWVPEGPVAKAARMSEKEAEADPDPFVLEMVRAKVLADTATAKRK